VKYDEYVDSNNDKKVVEKIIESVTRETQSIKQFPDVLKAKHVATLLGACERTAYEIIERTDFPLIRLGRLKR
jgi:hypothetical protein